MKLLLSRIAAPAFLASLALAPALHAQVVDLGHIEFVNSGSEEAQEPFLRGVLLLHSFEYEDAREEFQRAAELDPDFALAYWGEALTHSHPLWSREDVAAARAALARFAPTPKERQAKAQTERERRFLASVDLLFGEGDRLERHRAYSDALGAMWKDDPTDLEAGAFHALSVLGTSLGVRDIPTYMRAASIGEEVYRANPRHPGALHYLIHSYDDPVHAPLGLRMAREYDKVAPAASHALHMPSHIYVALGMWDESCAANINSIAAADARRDRKGLAVDERAWHALWWLHYSRLQQGRMDDATAILQELASESEAAGGSKRTRYHLVVTRAAHVIETRDWDGFAANLEIDVDDLEAPTIAADHLVRGLTALGRADTTQAKQISANMRGVSLWDDANVVAGATLASCCAPASAVDEIVDGPGRMAAEVMARELEAAIRIAEGEQKLGLELLRSAAALEDKMGFDFGPPTVVLPAHEALGEALLAAGKAEAAVAEFQASLARTPRRAASLRGLAAAADAAGDDALALATRAELADVQHLADRE